MIDNDSLQACIDVVPKNPANFNVDNVRVVKILGGGAHDSKVVKGVVIKRSTEGSIQDVTDAKVAVFAQGVDTASTETKVVSCSVCASGLPTGPAQLQTTSLISELCGQHLLAFPFRALESIQQKMQAYIAAQ